MVGLATPSFTPGTGAGPRADAEARVASIGECAPEAQAAKPTGSAAWSAARESVRRALTDLNLTLAAGGAVVRLLERIEEAASAGDQAGVLALVGQLHEEVDRAIRAGARALTGASVRVGADADAAPLEILGLDLRLKNRAEPDDALRLSRASLAADASSVAKLAKESTARIRSGCERLDRAAQRLQAHDGLLALAEGAVPSNVRSDLDADAARLLALKVRQGLSEAGGAIANARPDSLLSLFRG